MDFITNEGDRALSHSIRLVLDNDERINEGLRWACLTAVLDGSGWPTHPEAAEAYQRTRRTGPEYRDFVDNARVYALDEVIHPWVQGDTTLLLLLRQILDLGNRDLWCDVIDAYMPDLADLEEYL